MCLISSCFFCLILKFKGSHQELSKYIKSFQRTFLLREGAANMMFCPSAKNNQSQPSPPKMHLKAIDALDWDPRKSSNNSPYLHGDLYRRFHILLSSEKTPKNLIYRIEAWFFLQFIRLGIFYNEESSILCTIQLLGVAFGGVLGCQLRKLFVH